MSHLACADTPKHPLNKEQLAEFKATLSKLIPHPGLLPKGEGEEKPSPLGRGLGEGFLKASLANSSGIFLGQDYHFDLARPGCALYGINPVPGKKNPMRPVATLSAPILQIREIAKRESVGYGATYLAKKGDRIATLGLGYADGFFRHLGNRVNGFIGNVKVPVVGRVSMDLVTVNVSAVPAAQLAKSPRVEFIGPHQDVDTFAKAAGTIGYEVFTRLGRRIKRVHIP